MRSRVHWWLLVAMAVVLTVPANGLALEKTAAVARGVDPGTGWRAATSCSLSYYNICTGWVWNWSGWSPNDRLGVVFDNCCGADSTTLNSVAIYVWTGSPPGYGFTGTLEVYNVDNDNCPTGAALYQQAWLAPTGYPEITLGSGVYVPGAAVAVAYTNANVGGNPVVFTTDHPAAGPTGPQACGSCYPSTRVNHTFYWGTSTTAVCPGSSFFDGICDSELWWNAKFTCTSTTAVDASSWGSLKALYR